MGLKGERDNTDGKDKGRNGGKGVSRREDRKSGRSK